MAANIPSRRRKRKPESRKGMDKQEQVNTPFRAGTDFIPLDVDSEITHGERDRDMRRKGKERERGRTRDANSPQPSPPKSRKGRDRQEQTNVSFEAGTDFIPLDDDSDVEYERSRETRRGRHAAHSPSPPSAPPPPLPPQDSRIPEGVQENGNGHPREWDRGKRKYDMVFDPSDGYQNKKQRTDAKSRLAPWVEHVDWEGCKNTAELFHREVEGFVNWISPTPQEDEIRGLVVAIISHAVTSSFPDAAVFPFGSYATKLYLPLGDIDLVIRSPSMAYADKHAVLTALAATIRRSGLTNKVTIIAKAKVPIVKFVTNHEYGRFAVDLSINQDNGIVAGHIINGFLQQFGSGSRGGTCLALRALVLLTKLFLSQRGMNEVYTGGLGSYAIVCLVISFLQMHPKIRHGQIDADANLGVLVVEFFELYGRRFHYEEVGISLREGGSYFSKRQRGWGWGEQWGGARKSGGLLSIEDPGDPSNDISSGSYNFQNVRKNLAGAHEILIATIYLRAGILEARRGGQSFSLRDRYEPGDMSILSSVLGVTQETLNNRALVKEVYEKQTLHRLVGVSPLINPAPTQAPAANGTIGNGNGKAKPKSNGKESRSRTPIIIDGAANGNGTNGKANGKGKPQSVRGREDSVQNAWAEADMVLSSDEEAERRSGAVRAADELDGRYAIGLPPPKKRRKTGRYSPDAHVVTFVESGSDSESEDGQVRAARAPKQRLEGVKGKLGAAHESEEADALRIKGMGSRTSSNSSLDPAAKRDYWLSKGVGIGGSGSDD